MWLQISAADAKHVRGASSLDSYAECNFWRLNYTCRAPARTCKSRLAGRGCRLPEPSLPEPYCLCFRPAVLQPAAVTVSRAALFELHTATPRTFADAQEACRARGGNLASPSPDRDFDALSNLLYR